MQHPERVIAVVGTIAAGAAGLLAHGRPWVPACVAAATILGAWLAARTARPAGGLPTFAIWGRWRGPRWLRFRDALQLAFAHAGYVPARGRTAPDILICGPGAPRLAGWTRSRVATYAVGMVPRRTAGESERWAASLLGRLAWDAVAYVDLQSGRPAATLLDTRGDEIVISGGVDLQTFAAALVHLLAAHAHGGDAGAAGF